MTRFAATTTHYHKQHHDTLCSHYDTLSQTTSQHALQPLRHTITRSATTCESVTSTTTRPSTPRHNMKCNHPHDDIPSNHNESQYAHHNDMRCCHYDIPMAVGGTSSSLQLEEGVAAALRLFPKKQRKLSLEVNATSGIRKVQPISAASAATSKSDIHIAANQPLLAPFL